MQDVRDFIADNQQMEVDIAPSVSYDLKDIIYDSYRLFNSKFVSPVEPNGFEKIYYPLAWKVYRTIIMSSDVDLKDLNMRSTNGKGIKVLQLVKMAVRNHLLRQNFGVFLDKVMSDMVWFGSCIAKRADDTVYTVDLRNYITQPNIQDPQERRHAETLYYTWDDIQSFKDDWEENWEEVEAEWERMQKRGESQFKIVEFWTWEEVDGEVHKVCKKYLDRSENDPESYRDQSEWQPYLELDMFVTPFKKRRTSKREIKKLGEWEELFPYEQADLFDAKGRFLAFGCGELLSGLQSHYNEQFNLKRKKDLLDLKGIFTHKYTANSNSLTQEFLDNLETGSILQMDKDEDLQRITIDTKTGEFLNNVQKLEEIAMQIMGVTASAAGEDLPSQTATEAVINKQQQQTTYDFVRERMHQFIVRLFQNGYFETIIDELDEKEAVAIIGDPKELQELDEFFIDNAVNNWATKELSKQNLSYEDIENIQVAAEAEKERLKEELKGKGDMRFAQLKKSILKNADYFIEFYVTNEGFDKNVKIQNLTQLKNDPMFTGSRRAVENEIMDTLNLNPSLFQKTEEEKKEEMQQQMMANQTAPTPAPEMPMNNQEALMDANSPLPA